MNITVQQRQIASLINDNVVQIIATEKTTQAEDEAIVGLMPDYMDGFRLLLDTLEDGGMAQLCNEYPGFYRFSQMLERVAEGCQDGAFDDILSK
ncbi:MAG: hypothetical protein KZQ70_10875 [gamma proteobacterium symbiont of Lucinoma myriamae]|nr:hypothetical protein [gamma proteobacterium symbiont of Lucinoma myriamae]MCU7817975.1 hypothetical protein [gamma proteobacterium symbiont of Lucinoma myriamae]MCU7832408.1 hypothetical protein [gamma proteobacterium symbiont of Lucinoma myriamae]